MSDREGWHQGKSIVKRSKAETPANKARHRATHFFQVISDVRREAKEAKAREARVREEDRIRAEVDRRWADYMAKCPPVPIPRPSQAKPEPQKTDVRASPPPLNPLNPADSASIEFYRWCFSKEEKAEEPQPWEYRNRRLYGGRGRR